MARTKEGARIVTLTRTKWSARSPAIYIARALRMFLRMHALKACSLSLFLRFRRALHRGIITRDDPLLVLPASPPSHPPFLVLFAPLGLNRHHPPAIYLYRKALDRVSAANAPPWKLGKKRVIGCGKRNVALYLLLLLPLVVVVDGGGMCTPLQGNIITRYVALRGNVD